MELKLSVLWMLEMAHVEDCIACEIALYGGPQLAWQNKIHNKFKFLTSNYNNYY